MKISITQFMIAFLCVVFLTNCQQNSKETTVVSEQAPQEEIYTKTDDYVKKMMDSLGIIGVNYAILIDDKLVHQKAMGLANLDLEVPMTSDKLFAVASISKLFSSTMFHQLLKQKNRTVDETIGDFLPERNDLPDSWKALTLKQLLSHTSGIPDQIDYQIYLAPDKREDVIEGVKDKPFSSKSGDENKYNATGFMLIQMVFEKLAGEDFESYMQKNCFDKFNLKSANYGGFKKVVPNRVKSYRRVGENLEMFPLSYSSPMFAAAGLNITLDDLVLWFQAVQSEKIISKDYLKTIRTPVKLNNGENGIFGLGWEIYELKHGIWMTGHGGAGISSVRHYWKEGSDQTITVILLTNGARDWSRSPDYVNMGIANFFMDGILDYFES